MFERRQYKQEIPDNHPGVAFGNQIVFSAADTDEQAVGRPFDILDEPAIQT